MLTAHKHNKKKYRGEACLEDEKKCRQQEQLSHFFPSFVLVYLQNYTGETFRLARSKTAPKFVDMFMLRSIAINRKGSNYLSM